MKKIYSVLLMFLLMGFTVFAGGAKESVTLSQDEAVTIKYAFWGSPDAIGVEADIIAAFEKQ
ncbi:MAG: phosphate ABC transporter substrate-binding protein, partial [Sphaerochaeta sp.]